MSAPARNSTFRFQYLLVLAAVLVPAAIFTVAAWFNREEVTRDGEMAVERMAAIMQQHARKVFDSVDLVVDRVEDRIHDQSRDAIAAPETSAFLASMKNRFDQLASIWISDENGIILAGSQDWIRDGGIAGRDFFEVHKQPNVGTYISGLFVGRATGLGSFAVSRRRYSPDGRFVGTVHASVNEAYFAEFFSDLSPVRHVASLIRRDGTYLVRHPKPVETGKLGPDSAFIQAIDKKDSGVFKTLSQHDNLERYYAYQRVAPYQIYVTYGLDQDVLLSRWYRNLIVYGATLAAASLILLWVSWIAVRHMRSERRVLAQLQDEIDQRQAAEERLRRSQRLEAIGQITGGIAHDFNNLLMVITGNAERLRRQLSETKQERYVGSIEAAARRGERLTRQLLAFSRQQTVTPVVLRLDELLPKFPEMLQSSLRGDIEIKIDVAPNLWPVKVDAGELELALLNLSVNARDAMPQGGKLLMSARNVTLVESPATDNLQGDFIAVSVRDTGIGIPADIVSKIFEPFFTTKEVGKGTGLGLSQVYGFAKQAGGVAVVSSIVGQGTVFTIYLPRTREAPSVADDKPAQISEQGSGTILFVEDNKDISDVTKTNLEELGYRVIAVANADTAMEILKANAEIDIVFSDIVMPGQMNGVDLAREIRSQRPDTPVILTTGYSAAAQAAAPDGFTIMPKPYQLDRLHQIISQSLRQRDAMRAGAAPESLEATSHG